VKALVTGGAGFIGSHIAAALAGRGADVRILDNLSTGRESNLEACPQADFVRGDITSTDDCRRASEGCDLVFHHAALVSVQESILHPGRSLHINHQGTLNVLLAARDAGVRRLVFASSAAVYGDDPQLPKHEDMRPTPISPYGADKAAAEASVTMAHRLWPLETVVLRYFNVFGPRQDPNGDYAAVVPKFIDRLVAGKAPIIFGDGSQTRDFLYIDDVVQANLKAAEVPGAAGGTFNVARGEPATLLELLDFVREGTGLYMEPQLDPPRPGDIVHSSADITRARQDLGFAPQVSLSDGLRKTADFFHSNT